MKAIFQRSMAQRIFEFVQQQETYTGKKVEAVSLSDGEWRILVAECPEYITSTKEGYLHMNRNDQSFLVVRWDMDIDYILDKVEQ